MNKFIVKILVATIIIMFPSFAYGQDTIDVPPEELKVQPMMKGDVAKFDGILLSMAMALKIKIDKEYATQKCQNEIQYGVDKAVANWQAKYDKMVAEYDAMVKKLEVQSTLTEDSLKFCEKQLEKSIGESDPWWKSGPFLFSIGLISGAAITVAIVYAVNQ